MEMISKQEAVDAIKKFLDYENHKENKEVIVSEKNGSWRFMVNKSYLERFEVIDKLQDFFFDKVIEDGQCRIEPITFVYTMFFIEDRNN